MNHTNKLYTIDCSEHIEKKNGLSYLSWAWAWTEVLKIDPAANWYVEEYGPEGSRIPMMVMPDQTCIVKVVVVINGLPKTSLLPVMDYRNKAIKNPDAFAINTAIIRCMVKAIAFHGLGLFIYAGEDLPEEGEVPRKGNGVVIPARPTNKDLNLSKEDLSFLEDFSSEISEMCKQGKGKEARSSILAAGLTNDQNLGLYNMIDSKTRTALRKAKEEAETGQSVSQS